MICKVKRLVCTALFLITVCIYISKPTISQVYASLEDRRNIENVELYTDSRVNVSDAFGTYQKTVDENIYNSLAKVDKYSLVSIYGDLDTPMFTKAKETINPCMALATTWGEAGSSYGGVSLTTVMDFNPNTYVYQIDWISVSKLLAQVDSTWYLANAKQGINKNSEGKAYKMPVALLQFPSGGNRETSTMTGLGVGPYQITSSDWDSWDLDNRVNPVDGWYDSLKKVGTSWTKVNIEPISDITVYAALSLGHQGGGLINYDFGKELITLINNPNVQQAMNEVGYQMYIDLVEKQTKKQCSLSDINLDVYNQMLVNKTGINFGKYTGGPGPTNKGNYTINHCLRYCFYKFYFTGGYRDGI